MVLSTLVCGVLNTARTGSMSSKSTEGLNTASTGSMMSSTEPRVQQAVPAVQTSEMDGVLKSIKSVEPVDISSARSIYSRNTASALCTRVPPRKYLLQLPFVGPSVSRECFQQKYAG